MRPKFPASSGKSPQGSLEVPLNKGVGRMRGCIGVRETPEMTDGRTEKTHEKDTVSKWLLHQDPGSRSPQSFLPQTQEPRPPQFFLP